MDKVQDILSRNIRTLREQVGLTRDQFSEKCGISTNYLSEIELGKKYPRAAVIDTICQQMRISPSDLFKSTDELKTTLSLEAFARLVKEQVPGFLDRILEQAKKEGSSS